MEAEEFKLWFVLECFAACLAPLMKLTMSYYPLATMPTWLIVLPRQYPKGLSRTFEVHSPDTDRDEVRWLQ